MCGKPINVLIDVVVIACLCSHIFSTVSNNRAHNFKTLTQHSHQTVTTFTEAEPFVDTRCVFHPCGAHSNHSSTNKFERKRGSTHLHSASVVPNLMHPRVDVLLATSSCRKCQIGLRQKGTFHFKLQNWQHVTATMLCVSSPNSVRCGRKNEVGRGLLIEAVTLPGFH